MTIIVLKQVMTHEEIEQKMDELSHEYLETHDEEIMTKLYFLARELEKVDKQSDQKST